MEELRRLPAKKRIAAIAADLKSIPKEVSDENVFHHKTLLRMWDSARIEAGVVTPMEVQRENSPFTFEELAKAKLVFDPASVPEATTPDEFKPIFRQGVPIVGGHAVNIWPAIIPGAGTKNCSISRPSSQKTGTSLSKILSLL